MAHMGIRSSIGVVTRNAGRTPGPRTASKPPGAYFACIESTVHVHRLEATQPVQPDRGMEMTSVTIECPDEVLISLKDDPVSFGRDLRLAAAMPGAAGVGSDLT